MTDGAAVGSDPGAVAEWYRRFAAVEAAGSSPTYARLCTSIAGDVDVLARLATLPPVKTQPNLLLAACRWLGAPFGSRAGFRAFVLDRWDDVHDVVMARSTQTNEAARCASLLPLLAGLPGPLALIEVGASAGLCLQPDRYAYAYDGVEVGGASPVHLDVATAGPVPAPDVVPEIAWRRGLDLHPLDVHDDGDVAWLDACIWPEHDARRQRLHAAVSLARADPPPVVEGDLLDDLDELIDASPPDATTVVFGSAVLVYLARDDRRRFAAAMAGRDVVWITNEGPGIVEGLEGAGSPALAPPPFATSKASFTLAIDGRAVAAADPHGSWVRWVG
ncbi:MAG: DUF2332 domain-containing protein [Actinomycetota bacterium]|nr:DUF2332 domain-containing protein [Actinomycetota bacterium]